MDLKLLNGAVLAGILCVTGASAQSIAQIGGPANPPPASFKGQQFVDSRGCLFLRAGYGGTVNWVARVDRNRKPICGMVPTGSAASQAAVEADMAPDPQAAPVVVAQAPAPVPAKPQPVLRPTAPVVVAEAPLPAAPLVQPGQGLGWLTGGKPSPAPGPTIFTNKPAQAAAPVAQPQGQGLAWLVGAAPSPAPQPTVYSNPKAPVQTATAAPATPTYRTTGVATSQAGVSCPAVAPVLERVQVSGGMALVCTTGDGSATGWRPPVVSNAAAAQVAAQTAPVLAAPVVITAPAPSAPVQYAAVQVAAPQPVQRSHDLPKPPKGWTYAWKDDRLNPLRGVGTAQGQAQQDSVWQRTIPMVLVGDPLPETSFQRLIGQPQKPSLHTSVATMSSPAPQTTGGRMIQIGSFANPDNAAGVVARLTALGLPVGASPVTRKGKVLQVVYAGPFPDETAQASLATIRGAGYGDAYLR